MKKFLIICGILVALFFGKDFFIHLVKEKRVDEYTVYQTIKATKLTEDCVREKVNKQICDLYIQTIMARIFYDASLLLASIRDQEEAQHESNSTWSNAINKGYQILQNRGQGFILAEARKDKDMCIMLSKLFKDKIEHSAFACDDSASTFSPVSGLWYDLEFLYRLQQQK